MSKTVNVLLHINFNICFGCLIETVPLSTNNIIGPRRKTTCLWGFANNTGTDQLAHPRSLITAFDIQVLESTISKLATREISVF